MEVVRTVVGMGKGERRGGAVRVRYVVDEKAPELEESAVP